MNLAVDSTAQHYGVSVRADDSRVGLICELAESTTARALWMQFISQIPKSEL